VIGERAIKSMSNRDPSKVDIGAPSKGSCPICSRPADTVLRPFCSKRCSDVDLSRWLTGAYAIPVADSDDDEDGDPLDGSSLEDRERQFDHDA
jgi:uncharacterized protein